jgi:hypothetical protein
MPCSICGKEGHNAANCPYDGNRVSVAGDKKQKRCECCGQYGYDIERHHTRGRSDDSDYLDVCFDCHLECCHDGDFQNLPIKPRYCRILDATCHWCG